MGTQLATGLAAPTARAHERSKERRATLAVFVDLFKVRIGVLMSVTALAGYVITPAAQVSAGRLLAIALCVLIASASAGAFNQYAEADLDGKMARTRHRAFVSGALSRDARWLWALSAMLVASCAAAAWLFNSIAALFLFLGAFTYGVIYTLWLKRRTWLNIVIGGASGSFAVLAGAAAANPALSPEAWLLALALFLWTPPHFWSLAIAMREEYASAGVPMLPVVVGDAAAARAVFISVLLLVASTLLPAFYSLGWVHLIGAAAGGAFFIWRSAQLWRAPGKRTAIQCFLASLVQLSVVLTAAVADVLLRG